MWPFRRKKKVLGKEAPERSPQERDESISEENSAIRAYVVTDTLDLHGFFPQQVPQMIGDFIDNARRLKLQKLRVVHGKGKSRLKWEVHQALKANPQVESFADAPPERGGWGATVVVLKEIRDQP
jgi:DNA-nicking Smr family endonuclease